MENYKITVERGREKVVWETEEVVIHDILEGFCNLIITFGFHPESMNEAIRDLNEERNGNDKDNT